MTRLLLPAAALLAVLAWGLWERAGRVQAEAGQAAAQAWADQVAAQLQAAQRASEIHRAALERMARAVTAAQEDEDAAQADPAGRAPASDYLRGVVGRLR